MKFCDRPFTSVYLPPSGEVWPCAWMHYKLGSLYEQDLDEIWHSEAAQKARETILDGSFAFCRKLSCRFMESGELPDLSEEEIKKRAVATDTPVNFTIANDRTCNIACTTCRTSPYCPAEGEREKIDNALEKLVPFANKAKWIDLNGYGEFLANPSFSSFLEKLRPENKELVLTLETNGVLFDEEHWKRFSFIGNYHVHVIVTINSLRREIYRYLSGGFDHLERVLNNLKFLSELRREGKINKLDVTMVLQESNFWEVPEYVHRFASSDEYEVDQIVLKPVYNWYGMKHDTYWFKNMLNPMHPYHKEYLKILADDCWNEPRVFDWGCHNIREEREHPLSHEKTNNRLLLDVYANPEGLSAIDFVKKRLENTVGGRIGIYGEDEFSIALTKLLQDAGADIVFRLTRFRDAKDGIPVISMQSLKPDMADMILLLDSYDKNHIKDNLRNMKFHGPILTAEELIEGGTE